MTTPPHPDSRNGAPRGALPAITLTDSVHERLYELAFAVRDRQSEVAEYLERELDRACVVADGALPKTTVTIGSHVTFEECDTAQRHSVTLVWPREEDAARSRLSVMTPVGAALIGLRAGQSIGWRNRAGTWRRLSVKTVSQAAPAETAQGQPA
ncbi:nucleoside diphosphate kinase regulator [Azospirillum agricola]|uniref:nucleoside diphosphate kinase regulator n=1 Tax=Azospirillum agricola TaxID=1720247 RepID=UPI000A0F1D1C|nr:nucleoside diphosphate kinase regulator [Azospirillum agricola]SMH46835.1 regulator of nucleoside diphosphate kinase [Azospirillum lipoferum]